MRIAIMTWFGYYNYGTFLQAAALTHFLESRGHQVEVINYLPEGNYEIPKEGSITKIIKKIKLKYEIIIRENYPAVEKISGKKFDANRRKYLRLSEKYENGMDLKRLENHYDSIVCGSDQIWSPNCFDSHYFLDFVSDCKKMIAYAPSFGVSKIYDLDTASKVRELLNRFQYLSVREESGAQIIKELTGRNEKVVLDPTLLMDAELWNDYFEISPCKSGRYILVYFLGFNSEHWSVVKNISKLMRLPLKVIPVVKRDLRRKEVQGNGISPKEFVELIAGADYICTDSYHAVLFSVNFGKQFTCFERFKKNNQENQNSRIHSILKKLKLTKRLYNKSNLDAVKDTIDYALVIQCLAKYKEESVSFLMDALGEITASIKSGKDCEEYE